MAIEILGADRRRAAPLFEALPATHGCVTAGLSGEFGRMWVDRVDEPTVAYLHLDFHLLVGDQSSKMAEETVRGFPRRAAICATPDWEPLLRAVHGDDLWSYRRVAFASAAFDRDRLHGFIHALPRGYRLLRVTAAEVERFAAFEDSLVKNFRDLEHFLGDGVGFAVEHDGEVVAGCSSFTQAEGQVEVEIDTAKDHRRRGLALATGSALILHCLDHGLEPCWDAASDRSATLAAKLGFTGPRPYTSWFLKRFG